jgi:hypothetical protein
MTVHPSDGSGLALGASMQESSYWESPQSDVHVSVPFTTPPSARTVAPLLT